MKLRRLIVLMFIAISFNTFSLDSLKVKKKEKIFFHSIGGGIEWVGSRSSNHQDNSLTAGVNYNNPFGGGFYRLIISPKRMNGKICFTLNGGYRSGSGKRSEADRVYSSSYEGKFYSTRFDLSFTYLLSLGKRENFSIGWGGTAGTRIIRSNYLYRNQNTYRNQDSSYYQNSTSTNILIGLNMELQYRLKIKEESGVVIGVKASISTPDGFGFLFTTSVFPFLALIF